MARVAIVTGGTRGIGAAIAKALQADGCEVAANFVGNEEKAKAFGAETGIRTWRWDIADYEACAEGLAAVEADVGPIDIVVNNAGITRDAMMHKMTPEQWAKVINVNLNSMFNMVHPVLNGMRERGFGRIVNISSINGQKGQMGQTNYSTAKAGVIGFTKALALETARKGITVNCVAPGYISTDMVAGVPEKVLNSIIAQIPVGRLGEAGEIGRCVSFLASDAAGFITGATLTANGGQFMAG